MPLNEPLASRQSAHDISDNWHRAILSSDPANATLTEDSGSSYGAAPQRRRKAIVKGTQIDRIRELTNAQLKDWHDNYKTNMRDATRIKAGHQQAGQAKKNAIFWVLERGIGNLGGGVSQNQLSGPLADIFSGPAFAKHILGIQEHAGVKRTRSLSDTADTDEDEEARRVRARAEDEENVRWGQDDDQGILNIGDDEGVFLGLEETEIEVQHGRKAPTPLSDRLSQAPWNLSSRQSSIQPYRISSSAMGGAVGGFDLRISSTHGSRGSRLSKLMQDSPLFGRGSRPRQSSLQIGDPVRALSQHDTGLIADVDDLFGVDNSDAFSPTHAGFSQSSAFQQFGPSAAVSTQVAQESQWVREALDVESGNFLDFIRTNVIEKVANLYPSFRNVDAEDIDIPSTTFQELLPPENNTVLVGAQGILHVLTLATRGMIVVKQEDEFGADIEITLNAELVRTEAAEEGGYDDLDDDEEAEDREMDDQ